jgi:N-sulfoglucosamine sulfohydrolase
MRSVLKFFVALSLIPALTTCAKKEAAKPNILFLLADDWSYPYSEIYGEAYVRTPNIEKLSQRGIVFENAFCSAPSCTPSRASILTGLYPHNLGEGVNLCGRLDVNIPTYVQLLRKNGYVVNFDRKGWGPGDYTKMGYTENPCGDKAEFAKLIENLPEGKPFFFWFGTNDPHRPFDKDAGKKAGIDVSEIKVPGFLPDTPEIRKDLSDYFSEIEHFDKEIGELLEILKKSGRLDNTIIVVASDNGMPFPHAKANLYDYGTRVPLILCGLPGMIQGKRNDAFVNLIDLTPTFLDLAGIKNQPPMDGRSLLPFLKRQSAEPRNEVFLERERHCLCRAEMSYGAGYPMRAIRTKDYLYIRNFRPNRYPAGDESIPGTPSVYGDVDGGITKIFMMDNRNLPLVNPFFKLGFEKRPAEELYILKDDPYNIHNVAETAQYAGVKETLSKRLEQWMKDSKDPRLDGKGDEIDRYDATTHAWITRDGMILLDEKNR